MKLPGFIVCALGVLALVSAAHGAPTQSRASAALITIDGPIGPVTSAYFDSALQQAEEQNARVVVLRLDTPGGMMKSMQSIIQAILASPIPVVGYVAPQGARAASAGTYILYATHIAAMAPTTHLGAATPVQLMGGQSGPAKTAGKKDTQNLSDEQRKILNDSIANIRSLAEKRGRNADWAEKAVRHAATLTAPNALKKNVINVIAPSVPALLNKINGRTITINGHSIELATSQLSVQAINPDWRNRFLSVLTNPTLAYLLFIGGILGIVLEATHPGFYFPGVAGTIALLFALFAFQILPVNYAGIALIVLGVGLMAAEAFVPSFGALGIGGVIAFVVGSVLLMDSHAPGFSIRLSVIIGAGAAISISMLALIVLAVRAQKRKVVSGAEEMLGSIARPIRAFSGTGQVRVHGELWRARTPVRVNKDQPLKVIAMHGLTLDVEPAERETD